MNDRGVREDAGYPCGCFIKVYVCPEHVEAAGERIDTILAARKLQYELREGREAGEDGDGLF